MNIEFHSYNYKWLKINRVNFVFVNKEKHPSLGAFLYYQKPNLKYYCCMPSVAPDDWLLFFLLNKDISILPKR